MDPSGRMPEPEREVRSMFGLADVALSWGHTLQAMVYAATADHDYAVDKPTGFFGVLASAAEKFVGLFNAGGETFVGLVTGIIPTLVVLLSSTTHRSG